eukprot:TRINITY_DN452_c0_g2_i3.p1 TRINITY_DN452_c0_g2~~TRINITY_DN452_c0_g2_i3.p1  ORF type:complete len:626 (+),score=222.47 TRINITY_DN452_c0_g2_i3:281-2158(+)
MPYYHDYFGIPYPLPKIDLLAIPDFSLGAMENWGCVTYREAALLIDPVNSSLVNKQWVALIVGHELAHQWFGNLVTLQWWTHLWLNEGFASWIEYLCVDHCFPQWDIWTHFTYSDVVRALELDSLKSSHPIEVEVVHSSEIDEIFDTISYSKGCSVIRMLSSYLGEEAFKKGLHSYLKKFEYKNALTEDLWDSLEESSGRSVRTMMDTWIKRTGYPLVTVEADPTDHSKFKLRQRRFLATGLEGEDEEEPWQIPISHISKSEPQFSGKSEDFLMFSEREKTLSFNLKSGDWLKLNASETSFFRVNYSPELLERLSVAVARGEIKVPSDRLEIQNDAFALSRSGVIETTHALNLASKFTQEADYTVWGDLANNINSVEKLVGGLEGVGERFSLFGQRLFKDAFVNVGWDPKQGESHSTSLLRSLLLSKLGSYGEPEVVAEAKKRFQSSADSLPADLRQAVYGMVVASGEEGYNALLDKFRKSDMQEEKMRCVRALGRTKSESLLTRTLELSLSPEIRSQDIVSLIGSVSANPKGRDLTWTFFKENFERIKGALPGLFLVSRLVQVVSSDFTTDERADEVEAFFKKNPVAGGERAIKQSIESIRSNAKWLKRDGDKIEAWLKAQVQV